MRFSFLGAMLLLCCVVHTTMHAAVQPASLFTNGAVLQRDMPIPVWGSAESGKRITVSINGQHVSTTAQSGHWMVRLAPMRAGGPHTLVISDGHSEPITLTNILIGDVWLCSGQSNMGFPLEAAANGKEHAANAADDQLRMFSVPPRAALRPETSVSGQWTSSTPDTARWFSAVGYYFGRELRQSLKVPIGLINSSYGGTTIQAWMSSQYVTGAAGHNKRMRDMFRGSVWGEDQVNANMANRLYNAMIAPLVPYAMRGVIWYQGESNAFEAAAYRTLMPDLIRNWRTDWGQGDFPFLMVQLAPFTAADKEPVESTWAELREAQLLTAMTTPRTGLAVITDVGDADDIHPPRKEPVGQRLALLARCMTYGHHIPCQGPIYAGYRVEGDRIVIRFTHTDGGLVAKDGPLTGWAIAGPDGRFVWAQARISGDTVVVSHPDIRVPTAVRYGWSNNPVVNLYNGAGLPASPFRTDGPIPSQ